MIRTLFVEDEYFVRQGFVYSLPWEKFGIQIIGEADNGESALEFLRDHEVDLLITDLTMPVKSGLELLHEAKLLYPSLSSVVLTCHRDFEFVQEALRLGALDYIVKTRLDTAELEQSLHRINERMSERKQEPRHPAPGLLLIRIAETAVNLPERMRLESGPGLTRLEADTWFMPETGDLLLGKITAEAAAAGWAAVHVTDHWNEDSRIVDELLSGYRRHSFPYRWSPDAGTITVSLLELKRLHSGRQPAAAVMAEIRKSWHSCGWIFGEELFGEWLELVAQCEPPVRELTAMTDASLLGWRLSDSLQASGMPAHGALQTNGLPAYEPAAFSWDRWTRELRLARECLQRRYHALRYSKEVYTSALKSLEMIRLHLKEGLSQGEVARLVGLSRSYFSQVFKDIFGMSFNEYVKALSICTAQRMLATTEHPIYWIAEQSGFQDERYFSRVFREHAGLLPSEYRFRCLALRNAAVESCSEPV